MGDHIFVKQDGQYPHISIFMDSVQFSSVAQSCPTLGDPMDGSTPGFSVHHQSLLKPRSIESVIPSNHLLSPSPPAFNRYMRTFFRLANLRTHSYILEMCFFTVQSFNMTQIMGSIRTKFIFSFSEIGNQKQINVCSIINVLLF